MRSTAGLLLAALLAGMGAAAIAAAAEQPNIVLILADDLGIGDTGVYGGTVIKTPHIDALAAGGVRFTQAYVSHPVCSPSRAGLMTGRYQQRHGWEFNPALRDVDSGMSPEERTLADVLKAVGYATGMVGKWHLGYRGVYHPLARGFDRYFGVLAGGTLFIDPEAPGVESRLVRRSHRSEPFGVYRGRELVAVDEYLTDRFTAEALRFVDRHHRDPFFLYLSHTAPHTPLQATARYLDRYRHIEDAETRIYAAMVASLDDSVGAIVKRLRALDELDNTLFVFSSDNGCAGYIGGACSNAPHAGFKRYHQEGGIRVPLLVSWPARLDGAALFQAPVMLLDLLATFAAAAGSDARTEDSVNLLPYLDGSRSGSPHDYLYWRSGPTVAIRDDRWKLIRYNRSDLTPGDLRADGRLQPPANGWPATSPGGQLTLLYDLSADPGESDNLASQHPDVVAELEAAHQAWAEHLSEPLLPALRSTLTEVDGETVQLIF